MNEGVSFEDILANNGLPQENEVVLGAGESIGGETPSGTFDGSKYALKNHTHKFRMPDNQTIRQPEIIGGFIRNTEIDIKNTTGKNIFNVKRTGENVGDVTIGDYSGGSGALWDYSAGVFSVKGTITADLGIIAGWTIGATSLSSAGITLDSSVPKIESTNYVSGAFGSGFHIDEDLAEFGNIACRGLIRTAVFQKDVINVMGGNFAVLDGDVLDADITADDASTLTTKATTTFSVGDFLRIKDGTDDEWLEITEDISGAKNTGAISPGTMANVVISGSYFSWVNPDNAKVSDDSYVTSSLNMMPLYDKVVSLVLADGSYGTENKKTGIEWVSTADTYFSYGGAADLWGETLTPADINNSNFGVILQIDQNGNMYSDYLKASNFGFTIPPNATIDGILVEIERNYIGNRPKEPQVDHIRITVYYTNPSGTYTVNRDKAADYAADTNPTWKKGATVVNYGQSGDGGVYMTASESNAPYLSVFTHAGSPWTDLSTKLRIGNLNGYLGYSSDLYGIGIGSSAGTDANLVFDPTNGIRLRQGTTDKITLDNSGNVTATGTINATAGKFGTATNYWSVGATGLTAVSASTDVIINYGKTDFGQDATNGFILGYDYSATKPKFEIGSSATKLFKYDGTSFTLIGGTITSGTVRTASGLPRAQLTSVNNRLDIYNGAGNLTAFFGGDTTSGSILYVGNVDSSLAYSTAVLQSNSNTVTLHCTNTGANQAIFASSNSNVSVNTTGSAITASQSGTSSIYGTNVAGCYCSKAGVWTDTSSKIMKENFEDIKVLDIIKKLDIKKYNYISEKRQTKKQIIEYLKNTNQKKSKIDKEYTQELKRPVPKHISPMAEDFYKAFGVGDDKGISPKDLAGVALQAIKELTEKVEALENKLKQ